MDVIRKKISLEQFKSRTKSVIPFIGMDDGYYPGLNWGKISYGVDFDKVEDGVNLYGKGIKQLGKMTYRQIMDAYARVKKNEVDVENESDDELEKLKSLVAFVDSKKVIDQPAMPVDPCCSPCAEPSNLPVYDMEPIEDPYFSPDIFFNVCLTQSANIVGAYTFATKDWIGGKRYFAGDKVIYDGKTFKLKNFSDSNIKIYHGTGVNCNGKPSMSISLASGTSISDLGSFGEGISEDLFDECIVKTTQEIVDMGYIYAKIRNGDGWTYYIRPSWGGYFNVFDGRIYFDELKNPYEPDRGFKTRGEYETIHWSVVDEVISNGEYGISACNSTEKDVHIEGKQVRNIGYDEITMTGLTWESKLVNFKRNTKTVNDNGIELQGRLNTPTTTVMDLQYLIGTIKNIDTTTDIPTGDFLSDIQIVPDHQGLITVYYEQEIETPGVDRDGNPYTAYTYEKVADVKENFIGSIYPSGTSFTIYDEVNNVVVTHENIISDIDGYGTLRLCIKVGDKSIIRYATTSSTGETRNKRTGYNGITITSNTSCNGGGFTIQPTGGTEDNYDVYAPGLLGEYGGSGNYVKYQTMDDYLYLVNNWNGETGIIYFKYYIGAELENGRNDDGEIDRELPYVYNGGKKRLIYRDEYRFTGRKVTETINGETRTFVYLDIDYDYAKKNVVLENIYNYSTDVIMSNITAITQSITEGGEATSPDFQNADYFMEDYQLGLAFVANNNENVYIDRGTATAFERHLRLSEVNTVEDLENYHNGDIFYLKH